MGVVNTDPGYLRSRFVSGALVDWVEFTLFDRLPERGNYHGGRIGEDGLPVLLTIAEREAVESGAVDGRDYLSQPWTPKQAFALLGLDAWSAEVKTLPDGTKHTTLANVPEKMPRGMHGYKVHHVMSGVRVLSAGNEDMGCHVIVSGGALKRLPVDAVATVKRCGQAGAKFTRIDVAVDDFEGALDLGQLVDYCRLGRCSSRSKEWAVVEGGSIKDGSSNGRTLYVGSRESDIFFRFYDKRAEQVKEGAVPDRLPDHWTRAEAECKGAAAVNVGAEIAAAACLPTMAKALFNNYVGFKDQTRKGKATNDSNKGRWDKAPWWLTWVDSIEKLSVSRRMKPTDFDSRKKWFIRQAAPSLALLIAELNPAEMRSIHRAGLAGLKDKHYEELDRHRISIAHDSARSEDFRHKTNRIAANFGQKMAAPIAAHA